MASQDSVGRILFKPVSRTLCLGRFFFWYCIERLSTLKDPERSF